MLALISLALVSLFSFADQTSKPSLYVATGNCYAGGQTTTTAPANLITRFNSETAQNLGVVADYNTVFGDSPTAIAEWDEDNILVAVENVSGRRIDKISKDGSDSSTYITHASAFNNPLRSIAVLPNRTILISKSSGIEKFNANRVRIMNGANPFIYAPAGVCATSALLLTGIVSAPAGQVLLTHAGAMPNNQVIAVSGRGYSVVADCLSAVEAPDSRMMPTAIAWHPSGDVLVAYAGPVTSDNQIWSYHFDSESGAFSDGVVAWNDQNLIGAPTAMTVDPGTGDVFVANGSLIFNSIEKFHYSVTDRALIQATEFAFLPSLITTRCVSSMFVGK